MGAILVGSEERYAELERVSIELYKAAAEYAATRGIIIADTKFEFGLANDGRLVLGDEVLTPDSSRFWPADSYQVGTSPPSFDKQYVRDWLETLDWNKEAPGPEPSPTRWSKAPSAATCEAYDVLTGGSFEAYLKGMGVTP